MSKSTTVRPLYKSRMRTWLALQKPLSTISLTAPHNHEFPANCFPLTYTLPTPCCLPFLARVWKLTSPLAVSMSSAPVLPSTPCPPSPVKNALPATKVTSDSLVIFNKYLLDLILLDLFVESDNGGDFLKTFDC